MLDLFFEKSICPFSPTIGGFFKSMILSSAFALTRGEGAIQVKVLWLNKYIYIYFFFFFFLISKKNFIEKIVKHGKVENDSKEIKKNMYEKEENL